MIHLTSILQAQLLAAAGLSAGPILAMTGLMDWLKGDPAESDRGNSDSTSVGQGNPKSRQDYKELEAEAARLRSLLRITASMTSTLNFERVLEMTLDLGLAALSDPWSTNGSIVGVLLMFEGEELAVVSGRGLSQADYRVRLPARQGVTEEALSSTEMKVVSDPLSDPELKLFVAMQTCRQAICLPLGVGLEIYGVLIFGHPQPGYFEDEDRVELLQISAQQAMIALQNARLYRELEQEKERIAEIQEDARKKLARDLHDGPTQSIGAIGMRVNFARRLMERDPKAAADELYKIEDLTRRTTKEVRQMLFTLRPLVLESSGLEAALQQLAEKMKENHNQRVHVEVDNSVIDEMEIGKKGVLFFIAEEAVNNARKHARAQNIWVRIKRRDDMLQLEIVDDGIGFNLSEVESGYEKRDSLGMVNLRERAELVNGILKIDSREGRGTNIKVLVPLSMEAAERLHRAGFAA